MLKPFKSQIYYKKQLASYIGSYEKRLNYIKNYGFCLFTIEVLNILKLFLTGKKVLEVGSGTGFLGDKLKRLKIDVIQNELYSVTKKRK